MKRHIGISAAALGAALVLANQAQPAEPPPPPPLLEAYGRLPTLEEVEISPDGARLAYIARTGEVRALIVQTLDGKPLARFDVAQAKVRDLQWAGPDHVLVTTSTTARVPELRGRHEWLMTVSVNVVTRTPKLLMNRADSNALNTIFDAPVVGLYKGRPTAFVEGLVLESEVRRDLFRVDLDTGAGKTMLKGDADTIDYVVTPDGRPLARLDFSQERQIADLKLREGERWRTVLQTRTDDERPNLLGLGRDGASVVVRLGVGDERRAFELAPPEGRRGEPVDRHETSTYLFDNITGRLVAMGHLGEWQEYAFLDEGLQTSWAKVRRAFKADQVTLASWTPDFQMLVILVEGAKEPGAYYVVDLKANRAHAAGVVRLGIEPEHVAPVQAISYAAQDGLKIPAYLTLPVGREAKGLPLVVLPHGGPQSRDMPGFDWWAQALASRGYAVLQPQFRGSDGFGAEFVEAGHGEWGGKMQTDLSDGVAHLAEQGLIDPKRVCIVGASYGGYAALAGATLQSGVYRCAASVNGVADLPDMLDWIASWVKGGNNNPATRYWVRFTGAEDRNDLRLARISPRRSAAAASAPILLVHGKDDTVVPYRQSDAMAQALKKAGKPVELVTLPGEDHWLSREATRMSMLNAVVAFVERHNPPR